jgi:GAF domain-containing protein
MAEALKETYQGLEKKITERTRDLSALYAALAPLASVDSAQLLQQIVERLKEATGADAALIRILDKQTKSFLYPAHVGFPSSYLEATRALDVGSAIGVAFMSGEPIIAADISKDPRLKGKRQLEAGFRSCAFLPLKVSGELRGIVHLASRESGHFNADKTEHLMAIARQMGVAMENRELLEAAKRRAREQEALNVIAKATSQSLRRDELLRIALDKVVEVTGRERGSIRLKDPVTGEITLAAHRGLSQEEIEGLSRTVSRQATEQVFATGQPRVFNDRPEPVDSGSLLPRSRSVAWIPMKTGAKVTGVLCVSTTRPVPFMQHEVDLLQAIASVINVSLENAQLYENERRQVSSLRLLVDASRKLIDRVDIDTLAQDILQTVVTSFGIRLAWIGSAEADGRVRPLYWAGDVAEYLRHVEIRWDDSPLGHGPAGRAIRTGQPVVMDVATDPGFAPWRESALANGYREVAAFPLMRGAKPFGHLIVYSGETGFFTPERVELLQTYTNIATAALESARLFDEARQQAQERAALNIIATAVSRSLEVDEILNIAIDKLLEVTGRERGYIRLQDQMTGAITLVAHRGLSQEFIENLLSRRTPGGKADQVFATGEPVIVNDPEKTPFRDENRREGYHVMTWIPLKARGKVVGILNVASPRPVPFSTQEVDLLQAIGNVIGIALENAWLYLESRRQQEIQKLLKELSQDITSLDIEALFRKVTEKVRDFFKVDISDIRLLEEGGIRRIVGSSGIGSDRLYKSGTSRGRSGWIRKNRRPLVITDITKETDIPAGDTVRDLGVHGYLAVPLFSRGGEVIGILRALTYEPRDFSQSEVDLLQQLANGAAIALTNARLFEETERRASELAALYAVTAAVSGSFDIEDILLKGLDAVLEVSGMDGGYIQFLDGTPPKLVLRVHRGMSQSFIAKTRGEIRPGGKTQRMIATKQPVVLEDIPPDHAGKFQGEKITAAAWVPIVSKDKVIAILAVSTKTKRNFPQARLPLLVSIANALGVALENVRLFQETGRNLERIRALREIDQAISSTLDLRNVLDILLEKIDLSLPYASATIRLLNKDTGLLDPIACRNLDEQEWKASQWRGGRGIANIVFETKAPLIIRNAQADARVLDREFYRKHKLTSYVGVPLIVKDEILGVLGFYTKEEHEFTDEEVEFLSTLAGQAAIAIHNSQLYEEARTREAQLQETNRMLSGLHAVSAAVSQSLDLDRVLHSAIEKITDIFAFDATQIHIFNDRTDELVLRSAFERDPNRFATAKSFRRGQGIVGKVAESGNSLIFEDVQNDPVYRQFSRSKILGQSGYRFFAVFPIKGKLKNLGALACSGIDARKLNPGEIQLLEAMADQIAVAIGNGELYEQLRQKIEELQQANKVKDEFLSVMSHELRTPLNIVMGYTAMIKDEMLGTVNLEQKKALEKVILRSSELLNMITSILYATSIEAKEVRVQNSQFALSDLLDELRKSYKFSLTKPITLKWDCPSDLPALTSDREKLRFVLQKIIDNATKFTETGGVTISAGLRESSLRDAKAPPVARRWIEIKVADTGVGIAKEKLPVIFEKFRQADSTETRRYGGVGLGLYIAKQFMDLIGGKIEVDTEEGKGSIFTVKVPCLLSSPDAANQRSAAQETPAHVGQIH